MTVSIVGDSISTFQGCNPPGYAVYYNREMCARNGLTGVKDTWWAQVNQYLGADLCVNNSFSGSRVTGEGFPSAVSAERLSHLRTEEHSPDMILIYMGFNDYGYGVKVSEGSFISVGGQNRRIFSDAYDILLSELKRRYPDADIVCGTLMRTFISYNAGWTFPEACVGGIFEDFNTAIRKACAHQGCLLADVSAGGKPYETLDGAHPTADGHRTIAEAWIGCLRQLPL